MFLDDTGHVVIDVCAHHQTILGLAVHGLRIDVILLLVILYQPSLVLKLFEVFGCFGVDFGVIFASSFGKIYFRFDDMIEAFFVVTGFGARFV